MKAKSAGILSAILGSICCVGPLLLVAVGLGSGAVFIGRNHWLFIAAAVALLAWAWTKYFGEKARCACQHRAMQGRRVNLATLILASIIVAGFAALNVSSYIFAGSPSVAASIANADLQRIVIPVDGMSCATCEIAVRHALRRVDGVKSVRVNAGTKTATVEYDAAKTNPQQLVAAINSTGYRASLPSK